MNINNLLIITVLSSVFLFGCKKDEEETPEPEETTPTYNFSGIDTADQKIRISMMSEIDAEMSKGKTSGTVVSATKLKEMYSNTNNQFADTDLNSSGLQLKDQTAAGADALVEIFMDSVANASAVNTNTASDGVAGIATSGSSKYLQSSNGIEYGQVISKLTMGATFYYQIKNYLSGTTIDATTDNNWDKAFAYWGVPVDFPTNITGRKYLGSYTNTVNAETGSSSKIMNAFITGRQAIIDNDATVMNQQRIIILDELEKVIAAAAIHELNEGKANFADNAKRNHVVSEGIGFLLSLKYIANANLSSAEIDTILGYLNYPTAAENLYDVSIADINNAIDAISTQYDLDAVKGNLKIGF